MYLPIQKLERAILVLDIAKDRRVIRIKDKIDNRRVQVYMHLIHVKEPTHEIPPWGGEISGLIPPPSFY